MLRCQMLGKEGPDRAACLPSLQNRANCQVIRDCLRGEEGGTRRKRKEKKKNDSRNNTGTPQDSAFKTTPPRPKKKKKTSSLARSIPPEKDESKHAIGSYVLRSRSLRVPGAFFFAFLFFSSFLFLGTHLCACDLSIQTGLS